jgi:hypothetical protein
LDSFAVSRVSSPAYIASGNPADLYNNIVLFIVQAEPGPRNPSEMHLFQCIGASVGGSLTREKFQYPEPVLTMNRLQGSVFGGSVLRPAGATANR